MSRTASVATASRTRCRRGSRRGELRAHPRRELARIMPKSAELVPSLSCILRCQQCAYRVPKQQLGLWQRNDRAPEFHMRPGLAGLARRAARGRRRAQHRLHRRRRAPAQPERHCWLRSGARRTSGSPRCSTPTASCSIGTSWTRSSTAGRGSSALSLYGATPAAFARYTSRPPAPSPAQPEQHPAPRAAEARARREHDDRHLLLAAPRDHGRAAARRDPAPGRRFPMPSNQIGLPQGQPQRWTTSAGRSTTPGSCAAR